MNLLRLCFLSASSLKLLEFCPRSPGRGMPPLLAPSCPPPSQPLQKPCLCVVFFFGRLWFFHGEAAFPQLSLCLLCGAVCAGSRGPVNLHARVWCLEADTFFFESFFDRVIFLALLYNLRRIVVVEVDESLTHLYFLLFPRFSPTPWW